MIITDKNGIRWVRTGDLGHITEDGLLFHEGRIRRIYMTAHEGQPAKIFPMLVEGALKKSASVDECSVVGRKRNGSDYYEAVAFVVKRDAAQNNAHVIEELESLCAENVPTYMIPAEYRFIEELPHTPIGKVDFRALEKEAQQRKIDFKGYQINDSVMAVTKSDAMVMHCLPAHREEEITAKVFEEHANEIFDEAENRKHVQKAILVKCFD